MPKKKQPDAAIAAQAGQAHSSGDLKGMLHLHKDALSALASNAPTLDAQQKAGVKAYFQAAHPRMSGVPLDKARDGKRLTKQDRAELAKIVEADRKKSHASVSRRRAPKDPRQTEMALSTRGIKSHSEKLAADRSQPDGVEKG